MNVTYPIIDADGHVWRKTESCTTISTAATVARPAFETYAYFPSLDGWNRGSGVPGKDPETPASRWLQFLDELGVQTTVLYPTGGLSLGLIQNPEWACVLARAYNSWVSDRFIKQSPRRQRRRATAGPRAHRSRQGTGARAAIGTRRRALARSDGSK